MATQIEIELGGRRSLDEQIARFRKQLARLEPLLTGPVNPNALEEFDSATERMIAEAFGSTSDKVDTYSYAQLGEAASMLNLQEEGPEGSHEDLGRESMRQRRRVLESCVWELEAKRAANAKTRSPVPHAATKVAEYTTRQIRSIRPDATLRDAGKRMEEYKIACLFVGDPGRYLGTITDAMLSRAVVLQGLDPATTPVKRGMDSLIVSIDAHAPIVNAVKLMKDRGIRHLAVTEDETIVGVLSVSDLLRYYSGV